MIRKMEAVKIIALTNKGREGIEEINKETSKAVTRWALKKLKTEVDIFENEVIIKNPAFQFCQDLEHDKAILGIKDIEKQYTKIGAVKGVDYKIEVI